MTNDHLDDEAISAYLDGEATSTEVAHVEGCDVCGARLEVLRLAAAAIGAPPPPPDAAARDAAVAAAVGRARKPSAKKAAERSNVVPLHRRVPPQWLAAVAAAVVVVALIPLLGGIGGGDDADMNAAGGGDRADELESSADEAAGSGPTSLSARAVTVDGGDVGSVGVADVRRLVEEAVASSPAADEQRAQEEGDDSGTGRGGEAAPVDGQASAAPAPCEEEARADFDSVGALRYRAVGNLQGVDVSILAFDLIGDEPRVLVLALTLEGCTIRLSQDVAVEP